MTSKAQVALEEHQEKGTKCKNDGSNKDPALKKACIVQKMGNSNSNAEDIGSSWGSTTSSSKHVVVENVPDKDDPLSNEQRSPSRQSPSIELIANPEDELSKLGLHQWSLSANMQSTARLMRDWTSSVYAFFKPRCWVIVINKQHAHKFQCCVCGCKSMIHHFLDTGDAWSTSNMWKHVKSCWGPEVLTTADDTKNANEVCTKIVGSILWDGSITAAFEWKEGGKVTYSHCQHMRQQTRCVHILPWDWCG